MNDLLDVVRRLGETQARVGDALSALDRPDVGREADAARVAVLRILEEVKNQASALQAVVAVDFARSQRTEQARQGVPADQLGRGVAEQVALARRESPHRAAIFLGVASILVAEMPTRLVRDGGRCVDRASCPDPRARNVVRGSRRARGRRPRGGRRPWSGCPCSGLGG